jgi:hypothetical protein
MLSKIKLLLAITLMFAVFCSCSDTGNEAEPPLKEKEPISIECEYLDSIFSFKNQLIADDYVYTEDKCHIINSKEELNAINPFDFDIDCVDFSKYTLIGGRIILPDPSFYLDSICLEETDKYYLHIGEPKKIVGIIVPCMEVPNFFWRLYPKLKTDIEVVIVKNWW